MLLGDGRTAVVLYSNRANASIYSSCTYSINVVFSGPAQLFIIFIDFSYICCHVMVPRIIMQSTVYNLHLPYRLSWGQHTLAFYLKSTISARKMVSTLHRRRLPKAIFAVSITQLHQSAEEATVQGSTPVTKTGRDTHSNGRVVLLPSRTTKSCTV